MSQFINFEDYYQYYLDKHQEPWNRRLHVLGNLLTLIFVLYVLFYASWWWLLLTPFIVYLPAFPGHWFFEKNKPALFSSNPLWAKAADLRMMWDILNRRIPF